MHSLFFLRNLYAFTYGFAFTYRNFFIGRAHRIHVAQYPSERVAGPQRHKLSSFRPMSAARSFRPTSAEKMCSIPSANPGRRPNPRHPVAPIRYASILHPESSRTRIVMSIIFYPKKKTKKNSDPSIKSPVQLITVYKRNMS